MTIIPHGQGGGGDAETPDVDPNTLQNNTLLKAIDLLCEGEIEGLANGHRSIYFNDVPLMNSNGEYNFSGVTVNSRNGTVDQPYMSDFSAVEEVITVNTQVTIEKGPIVRSVSDPNIDDIRVIAAIPSLCHTTDEGDRLKTTLSYTVHIQAYGKPWVIADQIKVTGKSISTFMVSSKFNDLTEKFGAGPWLIKMERNTADSTTSSYLNDISFASIVTVINERLVYPSTAYIGYGIDAQLFGNGIPKRTYDVKGLKIHLPLGYDPKTREYPEYWNGGFTSDTYWSDNPAFCLYDLLTNKTYGRGIESSRIDKAAFYLAAKFCDELVDGAAGKEPRVTFNSNIKEQANTYHMSEAIAGMFFAKILWTSGLVTLMHDRPSSPVMTVGPANVIDGIFSYSGTGLTNRNTSITVAWNDPANYYKTAYEVLEDAKGIDSYGYKNLAVTAYGCTSRAQARRYAKWILFTELYQTETVSYTAGLDHLPLLPGHVISLHDPDLTTSIQYGGRLKKATETHLLLDRTLNLSNTDLTEENNYTISVVCADGSLETRKVAHINEEQNEVIVDMPFETDNLPQPFHMWGIFGAANEIRLYRIVSKREISFNTYEITALLYLPDKFKTIDAEGSFVFNNASSVWNVSTEALKPPTNLKAAAYSFIKSGVVEMGTILSWTHTDDVRVSYYEIEYFKENEPTVFFTKTASSTCEIVGIEAGVYGFRVRSVGNSPLATGLYSEWAVTADFIAMEKPSDVDGNGYLPTPNVHGLEITGQGLDTIWRDKDLCLSWAAIESIDFGADAHGIIDRTIKHYVVKIYRTDDGVLLFETISETNNYIFNFAKNTAQSLALGYNLPTSNLTIKVRGVDRITSEESEQDAILTVNNLPPVPVHGLNSTGFMNGVRFSWEQNRDLDFAQYQYRFKVADDPWDIEWQSTTTNGVSRLLTAAERAAYPENTVVQIEIKSVDNFGLVSTIVTDSQHCDFLSVATVDIDDFAIDASKMFSKIPVLENETWTGNTETKSVAWNNHNLYFAGVKYIIQAGESIPGSVDSKGYGKQYIYWNYPNTYYSISNVHPGEANLLTLENGFIICVNISGTASPAWNSIANEVIGSAHIMRAAIGDLQVDEISASKIKADTVMTPGVTIGGMRILPGAEDPTVNMPAGLYINSEKMGYYNNGWQTYQDKNGRFFFGGPDPDKSIMWSPVAKKLTVGNDNIIIDTEENKIIVAEDGGPDMGAYAVLKDGDISFYDKFPTSSNANPSYQYQMFKSAKQIIFNNEPAISDAVVEIDGYFKKAPKIILSPDNINTYSGSAYRQDQTLSLTIINMSESFKGSGRWRFTAACKSIVKAGTHHAEETLSGTIVVGKEPWSDKYNLPFTRTGRLNGPESEELPKQTYSVTVNLSAIGSWKQSGWSSNWAALIPNLWESYGIDICMGVQIFTIGNWSTIKWASPMSSQNETRSCTLLVTSSDEIIKIRPVLDISNFNGKDWGAGYVYFAQTGQYSLNQADATVTLTSYSCEMTEKIVDLKGHFNWLAIGS